MKGTEMSIFINPEEHYSSPEPEELCTETETYLRSILMAINLFQQDIAEMELAPEDINHESDAKQSGYKMDLDVDDIDGRLW